MRLQTGPEIRLEVVDLVGHATRARHPKITKRSFFRTNHALICDGIIPDSHEIGMASHGRLEGNPCTEEENGVLVFERFSRDQSCFHDIDESRQVNLLRRLL